MKLPKNTHNTPIHGKIKAHMIYLGMAALSLLSCQPHWTQGPSKVVWKNLLTVVPGELHVIAKYEFRCADPDCRPKVPGPYNPEELSPEPPEMYIARWQNNQIDTMLVTTFQHRPAPGTRHKSGWSFSDSVSVMMAPVGPKPLNYFQLRRRTLPFRPDAQNDGICTDRLFILDLNRRRLLNWFSMYLEVDCQGENGIPQDPMVGVIASQDSLFVTTKLLDGLVVHKHYFIHSDGLVEPNGRLVEAMDLPN